MRETSPGRFIDAAWALSCVALLCCRRRVAQTPADAPTFAKRRRADLSGEVPDLPPSGPDGTDAARRPTRDVRPWVRSIRSKVAARIMPPWHLDKTVGIQSFKNDISLSDAQIETIVSWIDAGAPLGNPSDLPPAKKWPSDDVWRLADIYGRPPDLVVKSTPWTQPAQGQDQWWQPVVDTGLTEDRWVKGIEIRPSAKGRRVVHHVVTYLVQQEEKYGAVDVPAAVATSASSRSARSAIVFRENTGKLMKAGSKIRFDIHYHSVGEELTDSSEVAVWFYPKGEVPKYRVFPQAMGVQHSMATIDMPPGKVTQHFAYVPLPQPARLENYPAAHARARQGDVDGGDLSGRPRRDAQLRRSVRLQLARQLRVRRRRGARCCRRARSSTSRPGTTTRRRIRPTPIRRSGWAGGSAAIDDMYHAHVNVTYLTEEDYKQITEERSRARRAAPTTQQQQP